MPAWPITIEGRKKIRRNSTHIFISNHQSQLDILVLFRLFVHFKWVSKSEIFKVPLVGWNMVLNRYIKLKRGDKESVKQMMADCEQTLIEGSSVFIFPEGTRSHDGNLKQFKLGAFSIAKKLGFPIQPIVVSGTMAALPKYSINYHGKHPIHVKVLDEIPFADFEALTEEETSKMAWKLINSSLQDMQRRTSS
jgi:1-acyl-sn-glycerol-3-phosphate acyltransferase